MCGHGLPLLLLHGFTLSGDMWRHVAGSLGRLRTCIAVDQLGHGASSAPDQPDRYRMEEAVADFVALMSALGHERFDCLGYSMGGRMALGLAMAAPERVRSLVLESASPGLADPAARAARRAHDEALARWLASVGIAAFVDVWERQPLFATQEGAPAAERVRMRAIRLAQRPHGLACSLRGAGTGAQPSYWGRLAEWTSPVLLITGAKDEKFTRTAAAMAARLPAARHVVVPDAGHAVHLEQLAAYLAAVTSFLEGG
nr:2-succinyl-6-hydroxy-2,4-cyclohexadiene-1-carboxylate synthase [Alicyclobacillus cellulosilyticus]